LVAFLSLSWFQLGAIEARFATRGVEMRMGRGMATRDKVIKLDQAPLGYKNFDAYRQR